MATTWMKALHRGSGIAAALGRSVDYISNSEKTEAGELVISKRGSPHLRRSLFRVITMLLINQPEDDAVYQFMCKKRAEGKHYYVYMTAASNKFLRRYYGKVRECLLAQGIAESTDEPQTAA